MTSHRKLSGMSLHSLLTLSIFFFGAQTAIAQTNQAESQLNAAKDSVNQAFNAVLDAEKSGANVNGLLSQINNASFILSQAENSYRIGDFNTALVKANSVIPNDKPS